MLFKKCPIERASHADTMAVELRAHRGKAALNELSRNWVGSSDDGFHS